MHTLHILKTFVVAREQFIFNTASYIIHSDWRDVSDQTVQYSTVQYGSCSEFIQFLWKGIVWIPRMPSLPSRRWFEPWWLMTVRSSSTRPPQLGQARSCSGWGHGHSLQPLSGSSGWTDDSSDTFHKIFEWAPDQLSQEWVIRLHKKSLFKAQQCPAVCSLLSGFWRSSLYKLLPWLGRAVLPRHGRSNVTD